MPSVDIYYEVGWMEEPVADAIKTVVTGFGQVEFSVPGKLLGPNDFSFKFHAPAKFDKLTHDIVVHIRLHEFPERTVRVNDRMALSLARDIRLILRDCFEGERKPTIGVELLLGKISWGAVSNSQQTRRGRVVDD